MDQASHCGGGGLELSGRRGGGGVGVDKKGLHQIWMALNLVLPQQS